MPPDNTKNLFLTPRSPNGSRGQPIPPAPKNTVLGAIKKGAQWIGDHVFVGAEGEKNPEEKPTGSFGLGVHLGAGEPSTGEDASGEAKEAALRGIHVNEDRTTKARQKTAQEIEDAKSSAQKSIEAQQAANRARQQKLADASIQKFRKENPGLYPGK